MDLSVRDFGYVLIMIVGVSVTTGHARSEREIEFYNGNVQVGSRDSEAPPTKGVQFPKAILWEKECSAKSFHIILVLQVEVDPL